MHVHLHLPQAVEEEDNLPKAVEDKQTHQQLLVSGFVETPQRYLQETERKQTASSSTQMLLPGQHQGPRIQFLDPKGRHHLHIHPGTTS